MARIVGKSIPLPFERARYEYEWQGEDETAVVDFYGVAMNQALKLDHPPKRGDVLWLGHLELVIVDQYPDSRQWEVALANGRGFQAMYLRRLFYWWANVQTRLILTLYVWGLADVPMYAEPAWKHVHWGRR